MRVLPALLAKDLRRMRRNPWVLVINLTLPFVITAVMGLAFGGSSSAGKMAPIQVALVDEDDSPLSNFLSGAFQRGEAREFLQPRVVSREDALTLLKANEVSAAIILPKDFAAAYLTGETGLRIELVKNPSQSFYPAIVEELLGVLVEGLNALSLNLGSELSSWIDVFKEDEMPDFAKMSEIYARLDERVKAVKDYLSPPLVIYEKETRDARDQEEDQSMGDVFAFVLPGMASMFLLFIADALMRDIFRETRFRTLDRFRTLHDGLLPFIVSKVVFSLVVGCTSGFVLFFGSGLIFRFHWSHVAGISAIVIGFAFCASGLLSLCAAIARSERRADVMNITVIIGLSFLGGAYFPAKHLPAFFRDHISPMLPNYWFIEGIRGVQFGYADDWLWIAFKLAAFGLVTMVIGALLFRAQLLKGARP